MQFKLKVKMFRKDDEDSRALPRCNAKTRNHCTVQCDDELGSGTEQFVDEG